MAAADLVEYVAKSLVDDPEAVTVEVVNGEDGHHHRAARGRVRHGQGHRAQRQRRQGPPHAAQGDVRPHGRAGQPRDRLTGATRGSRTARRARRTDRRRPRRLTVGLVRGLRGLRGHVRVELLTDRPEERFVVGAVALPGGVDAHAHDRRVVGRRRRPGLVAPLRRRSPDRAAAETLRDLYLEIDTPDEPPRARPLVLPRARGRSRCARPTARSSARSSRSIRAGGAEVFVVRGPRGEIDVPGRDRDRHRARPGAGRADRRPRRARPRRAPVEDDYVRPRDRRPPNAAGRKPERQARAAAEPSSARRRGPGPDAAAPTRTPDPLTLEIDVLTLFPPMVEGPLAREHPRADPRARPRRPSASTTCASGASGRHRTVDDYTYGGGAGMVLRADVVAAALDALRRPDST